VTPVRPRKRKGDVVATDGLNRNWRCLEELSADRQGRGRRSGQDFHCANMEPLLDSIRPDKEASRDPLRQPDPSLILYLLPLRCWDVYLNLNTRAAAILLAASDMHNRGFVEDLETRVMWEGM